MIDVPVPTRAEVADCADAVRQQADALMLSGETAAGQHPVKTIQTLQDVRCSASECSQLRLLSIHWASSCGWLYRMLL